MATIIDLALYAKDNLPELINTDGLVPILEPIDNRSRDILIDIQNEKLKWNPFQIELLLDEIKNDLNFCMDLRASGQNLETQAVQEILSHQFLNKEIELQKEMFDFQLNDSSHEIISNQTEIMQEKIYRNNRLFKSYASESSIEQNKKAKENILGLEKRKIELKESYNKKTQEQRGIKGSALNLSERFNNVKEVFEIKLRELYSKVRSVSDGLEYIFKDSLSEFEEINLPELVNDGYLLKLYDYIYKLSSKIDEIKQNEQNFTLIFNLKHSFKIDEVEYKFFTNAQSFDNSLKNGILKFTLPEELFNKYLNLRLQGISIFLNNDKKNSESLTVPFKITPPDQLDGLGNNFWTTPNFHVSSNYRKNESNIQTYYSSHLLTNRSLNGEWTLETQKRDNISFTEGLIIYFHVSGKVL